MLFFTHWLFLFLVFDAWIGRLRIGKLLLFCVGDFSAVYGLHHAIKIVKCLDLSGLLLLLLFFDRFGVRFDHLEGAFLLADWRFLVDLFKRTFRIVVLLP